MCTKICATALACVAGPDGKRVTFKLAVGVSVHGLMPLVDAKEMPNDVIALDTVTAAQIPHAALRAELRANPALWESVAIDMTDRARRYTEQMKRFVFDQPRVRLANLLAGMAHSAGGDPGGRPVQIGERLSQELIAEMLGISRQWASTLIRDLTEDGLVKWTYGRVTVLGLAGLRNRLAPLQHHRIPRPGRQDHDPDRSRWLASRVRPFRRRFPRAEGRRLRQLRRRAGLDGVGRLDLLERPVDLFAERPLRRGGDAIGLSARRRQRCRQ